MEKVSYSYTRQNLSKVLNQIGLDSEASCIETNYLLKSGGNAKELITGLNEANKCIGTKIDF
ncbi:MAG: hypothetical protein COA94_08520 [Rickettsiales bacterium]|nr:MAG: hypothetical protein COA94_08520 [Rickettsiales bacterium]